MMTNDLDKDSNDNDIQPMVLMKGMWNDDDNHDHYDNHHSGRVMMVIITLFGYCY